MYVNGHRGPLWPTTHTDRPFLFPSFFFSLKEQTWNSGSNSLIRLRFRNTPSFNSYTMWGSTEVVLSVINRGFSVNYRLNTHFQHRRRFPLDRSYFSGIYHDSKFHRRNYLGFLDWKLETQYIPNRQSDFSGSLPSSPVDFDLVVSPFFLSLRKRVEGTH